MGIKRRKPHSLQLWTKLDPKWYQISVFFLFCFFSPKQTERSLAGRANTWPEREGRENERQETTEGIKITVRTERGPFEAKIDPRGAGSVFVCCFSWKTFERLTKIAAGRQSLKFGSGSGRSGAIWKTDGERRREQTGSSAVHRPLWKREELRTASALPRGTNWQIIICFFFFYPFIFCF